MGPVPGLPGVAVAAGHEGSGLCLGPVTAELVLHHLLGLELGGFSGAADADVTEGAETVRQLLAAAQELLPERRLQAAAAAAAQHNDCMSLV